MKAVQGFMTSDDKFFDTLHEARLHEAEYQLDLVWNTLGTNFALDEFINAYSEVHIQLKEFLDATEESYKHQTREANNAEGTVDQPSARSDVERDTSNDGGRESVVEDVLQQSPRRHIALPNVGGSPRTEEVQVRSQKSRPRSGKRDA